MDVTEWLDTYAKQGSVLVAKRLAGNDTKLNESNQAGPYLPTEFLFSIFPSLTENKPVREAWIDLYIDSHTDHQNARVVWYLSKKEGRITNLGGIQSALLDPESTGAIALFAFDLDDNGVAKTCHVWVADNALEEDIIEDRLGPVEPRRFTYWSPGFLPLLAFAQPPASPSPCWLTPDKMPPSWLTEFPTGKEIIAKTMELRPGAALSVDDRMVQRRECEYQLFQSIEEALLLPEIKKGFQTIKEFVDAANSILNSRKSRSGKSLEYHAHNIFTEENMVPEKDFSHGATIHVNKRPDFIFPSVAAYNDGSFPEAKLRMLAAKTSCKERWTQVLEEATRIKSKHLLTLQEVSVKQFTKMKEADLQLVVPKKLQGKFHKDIQPQLMTLEGFIAEVRAASLV